MKQRDKDDEAPAVWIKIVGAIAERLIKHEKETNPHYPVIQENQAKLYPFVHKRQAAL